MTKLRMNLFFYLFFYHKIYLCKNKNANKEHKCLIR